MNSLQEHGRNRNSLADIEEQLSAVFDANPAAAKNADGVAVIPGNELPTVLRELSSQYGVVLMSPAEELEMKELLVANPGIEVTPNQLLSLVAARTAAPGDAPPPPPKDDTSDPRSDSSGASSPDTELRGRGEGPDGLPSLSRTSSIDSNSHAPATPQPSGRVTSASPFDSTLRQRSTPLSAAAPSAWTRKPLPASRRRKSESGSVNGNRSSSDNEVCYLSRFYTCTHRAVVFAFDRTTPSSPLHGRLEPLTPFSSIFFSIIGLCSYLV